MSQPQRSLERRALRLGTANALDYAVQFMVPIVLTRALDAQSFGEYRLLWLAVATLMVIVPMFMSESLYYFVPRSTPAERRLYVNQTILWLSVAGLVAAWALSPWNPWLPQKLQSLAYGHGLVVPAFVLCWIVAYLLDVLPTVDERVGWQANAIVGMSLLRAVVLSAVALATHDLGAVLVALAVLAALKVALLFFYVAQQHGLGRPLARADAFAGQVRHAAPFGLSGMLHGLRTQADQWVVAALFSVAMFASFSIATVLGPLVQLFRKSVNHVFLPSMSRSHSDGDLKAMLQLNSRANAMVALLVYPLLAFAFVFAEPLVAFVYTPTYLDAAPVLRVYAIALVVFVVELNSIMLLLKQGPYAAAVNAGALALAVPLSYFGAVTWGLPGAALGSVVVIYGERLISLVRIARQVALPVGQLQDWGTLVGILAAASVAALGAGAVLSYTDWTPFATLAAGGMILLLAYPAALHLTGQRRELVNFFASLRNAGAQPAIAE